jgi:light-regulated signal transduction histidine kinase (bacteriophytochrome)
MDKEQLGRELGQCRANVIALQKELEKTNQGTLALTLELEESREALAMHASELKRANVELESLNAELNAFSFSVSHDLRSPLRAISGFSTALEEDYGGVLDDEGRELLARIQAAAARMAELIDDLLQLSRATRAEMSAEDVDLTSVANGVVSDLRSANPGRNVSVVVRPGIICRGDRRLLTAVMENLIGNAWKFTSRREEAAIEIGSYERDGDRVVYVNDNGAGFDSEHAQKMFAPFQRLHTTEEFPGTGIGLATVKRIVQRHGGRVWAEGHPGGGAKFMFTVGLPIY